MPEYLEIHVDKFTFKIATDRYYTREGVWILPEGNRVRLGLSDFQQQRSGDIAFVNIKPPGTILSVNDELATVETIKVNLDLLSPVTGVIVKVNPDLDATPEKINQSPYEEGWLCEIETSKWETEKKSLLDAQVYFSLVKQEAEDIGKK